MSTPRVELIAQNIETALDTVTVANGWNQDLVVERPNRQRKRKGVVDHLTIIGMADPILSESSSQGKLDWFQPFDVVYYSVRNEGDTTAIDSQLMTGWADIVKKLREDIYRGSDAAGTYAINTLIDPPTFDSDAEGAWEAIICSIRVQYRTDENDPFTA